MISHDRARENAVRTRRSPAEQFNIIRMQHSAADMLTSPYFSAGVAIRDMAEEYKPKEDAPAPEAPTFRQSSLQQIHQAAQDRRRTFY